MFFRKCATCGKVGDDCYYGHWDVCWDCYNKYRKMETQDLGSGETRIQVLRDVIKQAEKELEEALQERR